MVSKQFRSAKLAQFYAALGLAREFAQGVEATYRGSELA